jgi:hypothetical protein
MYLLTDVLMEDPIDVPAEAPDGWWLDHLVLRREVPVMHRAA